MFVPKLRREQPWGTLGGGTLGTLGSPAWGGGTLEGETETRLQVLLLPSFRPSFLPSVLPPSFFPSSFLPSFLPPFLFPEFFLYKK